MSEKFTMDSPPTTRPKQGERFLFIDGLRGIAVFCVVLVHSRWLLDIKALSPGEAFFEHVTSYLKYSVDIFFVVSGFVITYSMRNFVFSLKNYFRFLMRRSIRIDPPYWVAITVCLTVLAVRSGIGRHEIHFPPIAAILLHLLYVHKMFGYEHFIGPFWTLCLEFQFYAIFPLYMLLEKRLENRLAATAPGVVATIFRLSLLSFLLLWPLGYFKSEIFPTYIAPYAYEFLIGSLLTNIYINRIDAKMWRVFLSMLVLTFVVVPSCGLFVAIVTSVAIHECATRNKMMIWLKQKPIQVMGKISYSLYLLHGSLFLALGSLRLRLHAYDPPYASVLWVLMGYVVAIAVAMLMYTYLELPCIKWSKSFFVKSGSPALPDECKQAA